MEAKSWPKWPRLALGLFGIIALALALGADKLGLSQPGVGPGQILLGLVGLVSLLLAWLLRPQDFKDLPTLARRFAAFYQGAALLLLNTLILLVGLELIAGLEPQIAGWLGYQPDPNFVRSPAILPYYQTQEWGQQYWRDLTLYHERYRPYTLWSGAPMASPTINIDEQGLRQTPGADCRAGAYRVFVFGGSTLWGDGAPDWGTIPAYLQQALQSNRTQPVCVMNFGQIGFVSTQNLIALLAQLQAGQTPDLVIFYDGINEIYSAYQTGQAGQHLNLQEMAQKIEKRSIWVEFLKNSATFKLVQTLNPNPPLTYQIRNIAPEPLAQAIVQTYFSNDDIVGTLAQHYHFDYLFFWQPMLPLSKKPLTPLEQQIKANIDPALVSLYAETYKRLKQAAPEHDHFYDISDALDDQTTFLWFDGYHIIPEGNQQVAQKMLEVMSQR